MTDHQRPWRYKALIAANFAIGMTGILLRPIYPKSIYIAMFVMAAAIAVLSAWMVWLAWKEPSSSRREKHIGLVVALMGLGASTYGIYLTLHSILR
ncbi:hypothetical protein RFM98_08375 [Mesorhizobium sp. VK9D]|uniref:hypothetical protein n=1 Tax=Mesorhizobium australafricanum TaxID=3072311 RepID=UPI002A23C13A|nr:hypothetical protein [Mesorhizobium sp. VK9D]MDX8452769.1 hypothetical protein [Mesorhizobium sp. VK9D]